MIPFTEVKEVAKVSSKDIGKTTKAFENVAKKEVDKPRHIPTINEHLKGSKYPGTNVEYQSKTFTLNGERVEGVFPKFDAVHEVRLPKVFWNASDTQQFSLCTKSLQARIERDPSFASKFNPRQLEQIKAGEPRISGYTWHHSEIPGRMQLVKSTDHITCRHTGGRSIWGGGQDYR
jgi:hypothetical protein